MNADNKRLFGDPRVPNNDHLLVRQRMLQELFPNDPGLLSSQSMLRWIEKPPKASPTEAIERLQRYPFETRLEYFRREFTEVAESRGVSIPNPLDMASAFAAFIDMPLRTEEVGEERLRELAGQYSAALQMPTSIGIRVINSDLEALVRLNYIARMAEGRDERGTEKGEEMPFGQGRAVVEMKAVLHETNLDTLEHEIYANSYGEGLIDRILGQMRKNGRWEDVFHSYDAKLFIGGGDVPYPAIYPSLVYSLYWEIVADKMPEKGYTFGNPFTIYLETFSPTFIPIGVAENDFVFFRSENEETGLKHSLS